MHRNAIPILLALSLAAAALLGALRHALAWARRVVHVLRRLLQPRARDRPQALVLGHLRRPRGCSRALCALAGRPRSPSRSPCHERENDMKRIPMRRASAYAGVLVAALALAPSAFAHAELFPNEIPSGDGYLLNLAVPNEKDNASTTQIQITMPADFDLEHVAPVPGWTVHGRRPAHGERRDGRRQLDHLEGQARRARSSRVLPFTGVPKKAEATTPSRSARPTRTAASSTVVGRRELRHAGRRTSRPTAETRARRAAAPTRARRSRSSRSSSAALGLLVGGAGLVSGRRTA